jgi:hypothetical protein
MTSSIATHVEEVGLAKLGDVLTVEDQTGAVVDQVEEGETEDSSPTSKKTPTRT